MTVIHSDGQAQLVLTGLRVERRPTSVRDTARTSFGQGFARSRSGCARLAGPTGNTNSDCCGRGIWRTSNLWGHDNISVLINTFKLTCIPGLLIFLALVLDEILYSSFQKWVFWHPCAIYYRWALHNNIPFIKFCKFLYNVPFWVKGVKFYLLYHQLNYLPILWSIYPCDTQKV